MALGADLVTGGRRALVWTLIPPSCLLYTSGWKKEVGSLDMGAWTHGNIVAFGKLTPLICVPAFRLVRETSQAPFRHMQPHSFPASLLVLNTGNHLDDQLTKSQDPSRSSELLMGGFMNFRSDWRPVFKQTHIRITPKIRSLPFSRPLEEIPYSPMGTWPGI